MNTVGVFQYGDFVFAHTGYDFIGPKIGFDIFRARMSEKPSPPPRTAIGPAFYVPSEGQ